jgi:uncharacterized protein with HEPN domain
MPDERQLGLLRDILDSGRRITAYVGSSDEAGFMADSEKQDAVLRRLEIIGEAASRLSTETRALFPELPFHGMRGMRNIIAHDYGEVDLELVWRTATRDIPVLVATLDDYFGADDSTADGSG